MFQFGSWPCAAYISPNLCSHEDSVWICVFTVSYLAWSILYKSYLALDVGGWGTKEILLCVFSLWLEFAGTNGQLLLTCCLYSSFSRTEDWEEVPYAALGLGLGIVTLLLEPEFPFCLKWWLDMLMGIFQNLKIKREYVNVCKVRLTERWSAAQFSWDTSRLLFLISEGSLSCFYFLLPGF